MKVSIRLRQCPETVLVGVTPVIGEPLYHDGFLRWWCKASANLGEFTYFSDRYWEEVPQKTWRLYTDVQITRYGHALRLGASVQPSRENPFGVVELTELPDHLRVRQNEDGSIRFEEYR